MQVNSMGSISVSQEEIRLEAEKAGRLTLEMSHFRDRLAAMEREGREMKEMSLAARGEGRGAPSCGRAEGVARASGGFAAEHGTRACAV